MNYYILLPVPTLILAVILALYTRIYLHESKPNNAFINLNVAVVLWAISNMLVFTASSIEQAVKANWIGVVGSEFVGLNFLVFILHFTKNRMVNSRYFFLVYLLPLSLQVIDYASNWLTNSAKPAPWGYTILYGPAYHIHSFIIIAFVIIGLVLAVKKYFTTKQEIIKKQLKLIIFGFLAPFIIGGSSEYVFWILGKEMVPLTVPFLSIEIGVLIYAATRTKFLSITPAHISDQIIKSLVDYLVVVDIHNKIAVVNDAFCQLTGRKRKELLGQDIESFFLTGLVQTEAEPTTFDNGILNQEGQIVPVAVSASKLNTKKNVALGTIYLIRDTREIKKLLQDAKSSEEELVRKNIEIQDALDDFYTMHISLNDDIADGSVEDENKKIKKRIEQIKNELNEMA